MIGDGVEVNAAVGHSPRQSARQSSAMGSAERDRLAHRFAQVELVMVVEAQRVRLLARSSGMPVSMSIDGSASSSISTSMGATTAVRQRPQCPRWPS